MKSPDGTLDVIQRINVPRKLILRKLEMVTVGRLNVAMGRAVGLRYEAVGYRL